MSSQNVLDDLKVALFIGERTSSIRLGVVGWNKVITESNQYCSLMGVFNDVGVRIDEDSGLSKKLQNVPRNVFEEGIYQLNKTYPHGQIYVRIGER